MQKFLEHFNTRQQMQKTSFEIFHYFDSKPGSVALHHHDFYEIYFFISGQVEYQIEGRSYQLQPGDLCSRAGSGRENDREAAEPGRLCAGAGKAGIRLPFLETLFSLLMSTFFLEKVENTAKECYTTVENDCNTATECG